MKYITGMMLFGYSLVVHSAPPETAIEPPCTRKNDSAYVGSSFIFPQKYLSEFYVRKNKAKWANYNKFVDEEMIAGKKAIIECYEVVPGPSNFNQYVFALNVDGFSEKLFADATEVIILVLKEKENQLVSEKISKAISDLNKLAGRNLWSSNVNFGYKDYESYYPAGGRLFRNLEMVKVLYAVEHVDKLNEKSILLYVEAANGEVLFKKYSPTTALLHLDVDWYRTNPRTDPIYSHWGDDIWRKIESSIVEIGMTDQMVKIAIGYPKDINKTVMEGRTVEQWVYEGLTMNRYYYFTNGILDAIQK